MNNYLIIAKHSLFIGLSYPIFYFVLLFNKTFSNQKKSIQMYIIKNFIKSLILFYISINLTYDLINIYLGDKIIDNLYIKSYGSLYVSNDIVALLIVKKLPLTTKIHHTITTLLLLYFFTLDVNNYSNIGIMVIIYSLFSAYAFMVNFYLAARYFENKQKYKFINSVRYWSYYIYYLLCIMNWSVNIIIYSNKIINNTLTLEYIIYALLLTMIVRDDIILLSWLQKKSISV